MLGAGERESCAPRPLWGEGCQSHIRSRGQPGERRAATQDGHSLRWELGNEPTTNASHGIGGHIHEKGNAQP